MFYICLSKQNTVTLSEHIHIFLPAFSVHLSSTGRYIWITSNQITLNFKIGVPCFSSIDTIRYIMIYNKICQPRLTTLSLLLLGAHASVHGSWALNHRPQARCQPHAHTRSCIFVKDPVSCMYNLWSRCDMKGYGWEYCFLLLSTNQIKRQQTVPWSILHEA